MESQDLIITNSGVEELLEEAHGDYVGYMTLTYSTHCWDVLVVLVDHSSYLWRAHLAHDGRITLSPIR
jgi:hypothetical protein